MNEETELRELKSRVEGLKVNRDALFEENGRFRADLQTSNDKIMELERIIVEAKACVKELQSELEGRMDGANEVIYQLELQKRLAKEARKDLRIEIIQMSGNIYYWALMCKDVQLAHSREIDAKDIIEPEADAVAVQLNLPVVMNERK